MKKILIFLFICFGFALNSQITITCYECKKNTTIDCKGCNIQSSLFTGIVIKEKGKPDIPLYEPYKVSNKSNIFTFEDAFGTKTIVNVTSVLTYNTPKKLYDYLSNCLCKPSTIDTDRYSSLVQDSILVYYNKDGVEIDRDTIKIPFVDTDIQTYLTQDSILVYFDESNTEIGRDTISIPNITEQGNFRISNDTLYHNNSIDGIEQFVKLPSIDTTTQTYLPILNGTDTIGYENITYLGGVEVDRDTFDLPKHKSQIQSNETQAIPYTGVELPTTPGVNIDDTKTIQFSDGTIVNYTYDGTVWGLNFIDKTLAQHDLRLLTNGTVERGSDSAIDPKGAQFLHDSYSHLNGFSDNWVGLNGFRFNINNESLFSHYTPDLTGFTDNRYLWKIQALSDKNVNFNFSTSTTHIPTTNTNNDVFMLGWNLSPGGGAEVIGKTGIGLSFENHYEPTVGDDAAEHHTFFIDKSGSQRRLSSFTINKDVPLDWNYYKTVALDYLKNPINDVTYSRTQVAPSGDVYFLLTDGLVDNLKGLETYVSPSQNLVYFRPKNMQSAANSIWQNGLDFGDFGNINTSAFNVIKYQNLVTFMFKSPLPVHADNASALTAGRQVGELYRTSDGTVKIVY